jgi:hypothetical protein
MANIPTENDEIRGADEGTANHEFRVDAGYDSGFLSFSAVTSITKLLRSRDKDLSSKLKTSFAASDVPKPLFLHAVLLKISPPASNSADALQYVPYRGMSRMQKKPKVGPTTHKKSLLFGDLQDPQNRTFAILEDNNDTHNRLFGGRPIDRITVGCSFAVKSPVLLGVLKSGSHVVWTDRPLEVLTYPVLPPHPLNSAVVSPSLHYFVMHNVLMKIDSAASIVPMVTKCNGKTCDRLQAASQPNQPCGCWNQSGRSDTLVRNTVLKITFYFDDIVGTTVEVLDFTSLKWSKLLFEDQQIIFDHDELQKDALFFYLQGQYRKVLSHVNAHGGWTIVGWYKRAVKAEEDKQMNISLLTPTDVAHDSIPKSTLVEQDVANEKILGEKK